MYFLSECVACIVVAISASSFLLTIFVLLLTIKDGLEHRLATSRALQKAGMLLGAQPAAMLADTRPLAVRGSQCDAGEASRQPF